LLPRKAGLAPAFLFAFPWSCCLLPPKRARSNKPLMACNEHWKSHLVLPMFRVHPLAFDPGLFPAVRA